MALYKRLIIYVNDLILVLIDRAAFQGMIFYLNTDNITRYVICYTFN